MEQLIVLSLVLPLVTGILAMTQSRQAAIGLISLTGSSLTSLMLFTIVYHVVTVGTIHVWQFYIDHLSAVLLIVVALLTFTAALFSLSYMNEERAHGNISLRMLKRYYGLVNLFSFTMICVLLFENLGMVWVAVEATTLSSALLVAFYFDRAALEAAWKYVMVCTVGICLALLGTILLYYAQVNVGIDGGGLSWLALKEVSNRLDPGMVKLAFVFILIGYGTKAGLAPMHTWLPDAHSQAPSPVSGLLSGALLSCALYAIIRTVIIVKGALGPDFPDQFLTGFGLLSIVIAVPFIMVQHDLKRLLAYSSIEHMGLITLGLGIGTPLAVYGALLHLINHAVTKSALFYLAGIVIQQYGTKSIMRIRGLMSAAPMTGTLFIVAVLAIAGLPPFSVFFSKFTIVWAAFQSGRPWLGAIVLLLMAAIFAGMIYYTLKIGFGPQPSRVSTGYRPGKPAMSAVSLSVVIMIAAGLYLPPWLDGLINQAVAIVIGGEL
ncbi:MAG: formate hydrogenlyase subunit 3/multisubunit Na+/H+ antiporter, MnhD subunit [Sporomusa sp.]|jgi:hydrogenase-4 component F|nr:formate hydrogenlyase subunit 3/multisubunit Na+/H+ antiporter, MnhD subunit [Sporomusa sp.]